MALSLTVNGVDYAKLSPAVQALYVSDGDGYKLDVSGVEDTGALKRAKDREKENAAEAIKRAKAAEEALEALQDEIKKKNMTVEELQAAAKKEKEKQEKDSATKLAKKDEQLRKYLINDQARKLAEKLTTNADNAELLLPHLTNRLTVDLENGEPITKVLAADGSVSGLSIADLEKEISATSRFSAIIRGSAANGGGATGGSRGPNSGAGKAFKDMTELERTQLYLADPDGYSRQRKDWLASQSGVQALPSI